MQSRWLFFVLLIPEYGFDLHGQICKIGLWKIDWIKAPAIWHTQREFVFQLSPFLNLHSWPLFLANNLATVKIFKYYFCLANCQVFSWKKVWKLLCISIFGRVELSKNSKRRGFETRKIRLSIFWLQQNFLFKSSPFFANKTHFSRLKIIWFRINLRVFFRCISPSKSSPFFQARKISIPIIF